MALPNIIQQINSKLPLSGGNMTGIISSSNDTFLRGTSNNKRRHICSGTSYDKGAYICLDGCEVDDTQSNYYKGQFFIGAHNSTNQTILVGRPNGTLTWGGNNVITSAGGAINGTLVLTKGTNLGNIGSISIANGDWVYPALLSNTSSGFYAISGNSPNQAGEFLCRANKDGTNFIDLRGCPDGTLTWGTKPVVCVQKGTSGSIYWRVYSDGFIEQWGHTSKGTITFPKQFKDNTYSIVSVGVGISGNGSATNVSWVSTCCNIASKSATGFVRNDPGYGVPAYQSWYACGY